MLSQHQEAVAQAEHGWSLGETERRQLSAGAGAHAARTPALARPAEEGAPSAGSAAQQDRRSSDRSDGQ